MQAYRIDKNVNVHNTCYIFVQPFVENRYILMQILRLSHQDAVI